MITDQDQKQTQGHLLSGSCPNPFSSVLRRFLIHLGLAPGDAKTRLPGSNSWDRKSSTSPRCMSKKRPNPPPKIRRAINDDTITVTYLRMGRGEVSPWQCVCHRVFRFVFLAVDWGTTWELHISLMASYDWLVRVSRCAPRIWVSIRASISR